MFEALFSDEIKFALTTVFKILAKSLKGKTNKQTNKTTKYKQGDRKYKLWT